MATTRSPLNIAPDDDPGGAPLTSWYTQGVTDGFGDRLLMFDNAATGPIELLRIRTEFASVPGFESALRSRFSLLTTFNHPGFAQARVVNHLDNGGGLTVASTHVTGTRLAALFEASRPSPGMHPGAVREVFGDLVSAIGDLHKFNQGIAHGALSADRVILTFDRRLVVTDYVFGSALERLRLPANRLWDEFGLVSDPASGRVQLDQRGDLTQLGLLMMCLVLGRRVTPDEYPERLPSLLNDFTAASDRRAPDLTSTMRGWLEQAIEPSGFTSVADAAHALAQWPARPQYLDLHAGPAPRALAPAQPTPAPLEDRAVVAAPAPIEAAASPVDATADPVEVAPSAGDATPAMVDAPAVAAETLHVEQDDPVGLSEHVEVSAATTSVDVTTDSSADTETEDGIIAALEAVIADVALATADSNASALDASAPATEAVAASPVLDVVEPAVDTTDAAASIGDVTTPDAELPTLDAGELEQPAIAGPLAAAALVDSADTLNETSNAVADATTAQAPVAETPDASPSLVADAPVAQDEPRSLSPETATDTQIADPVLETPIVAVQLDAQTPAVEGESDDISAVRAAAAAAFGAVESLNNPTEIPAESAPAVEEPQTPTTGGPDLLDIDSRLKFRSDLKPLEDAASSGERIQSVVRVQIPETPPAADRPLDSPLFRRMDDPRPADNVAASSLLKPAAAGQSSFILPEPPASTPASDATPSLRFIKLGPSNTPAAPEPAPPPTLAAPSAPPARVPFAWASNDAPSVDTNTEVEAETPHESSPLLRWVVAALVTLAVGQGLVILQLLSRQPLGAVSRIHVDSPTPGDTVLLDGKEIGVTPLDVSIASPDSVVQVVPRGKEASAAPETAAPAAPSGGASSTTPDQTSAPASVKPAANAPDAIRGRTGGVRVVSPIALQVLAGKEFLGSSDQGPVFTTPGTRDLDFVNNTVGFRTTQRVQVQAGQVVAVRVDPPDGVLSVTAQPSAQVWIDGRRVGDTPITNLAISLGEHEIVFRNPKLGERRQKTVVQSNKVTRVNASFTP